MPRSTKCSQHKQHEIDNDPVQEDSSDHEECSNLDQEPDQEIVLKPSQAWPQLIQAPKIDGTVNNGLYHRLLNWHLKCENIFKCDLVMLSER